MLDVQKLLDEWRSFGLDAAPLEAVLEEPIERDRGMRAQKAALADRDGLVAARDALTSQLARGEIDFAAALAQDAALADGDRAMSMLTSASRKLLRDTLSALFDQSDALVTEHLKPAFAARVDEATKLAPTVAGIETDEAAHLGGPKAAAAWSRLVGLVDEMKVLRGLGRVNGAAMSKEERDRLWLTNKDFLYEHPERLPDPPVVGSGRLARIGGKKRHPVRVLCDAIECGAEPGIFTADEVRQRPAGQRWAPPSATEKAGKRPFPSFV